MNADIKPELLTGKALLQAADLHVELDAESGLVRALEAVQLSIARGETFALVGESGCGKSMTALALMRLLPENGRIAAGTVQLQGEELLALPEAAMRRRRGGRIGIIFQDPSTSLNPVMRVGDQIIETIVGHTGLRGAQARAKAIEWLQLVGIPEPERRIDSYPFQMSGGQKQRVMIAIALAAEPELLIADEPTTALDVTIQAQILDLLKSLQARLGMSILLITHDLAVVAQMAHRVALMYAGQIVEVAESQDFFAQPLHPYARQLFRALPDANKRGQALATIPGTVPALNRSFQGCRFADRCAEVMPHCASTPVPLFGLESAGDAVNPPAHPVRCLLYAPGMAQTAADAHGRGRAVGRQTIAAEPHAQPAAEAAGESAAANGSPLLQVRDLRVHFPIRKGLLKRTVGYVKAVDGVSFEIAPGRTLALVGESGCGKTTIGKALLQLLRGQADISGDMLLQGQSLATLDGAALRQARQKIQIVFQDPYASLDPRMRVADILEEGMISLRPEMSLDQRRTRLAGLLEQVGLRSDALQRYPHEFSGGQRQRLAIARALAVEPSLIVCDEPTSALDVSVQAQILNLLKQLQRELGIATLFITHNIGVVEYLAHDIAVMRGGVIVEQGPAEQILRSPKHAYTQTLLAAAPRL